LRVIFAVLLRAGVLDRQSLFHKISLGTRSSHDRFGILGGAERASGASQLSTRTRIR
jgi:hypothetical protein